MFSVWKTFTSFTAHIILMFINIWCLEWEIYIKIRGNRVHKVVKNSLRKYEINSLYSISFKCFPVFLMRDSTFAKCKFQFYLIYFQFLESKTSVLKTVFPCFVWSGLFIWRSNICNSQNLKQGSSLETVWLTVRKRQFFSVVN